MEVSTNLKVYVSVRADFRDDGIMLPREITWEDGRKYEIERVVCPIRFNGLPVSDERCGQFG